MTDHRVVTLALTDQQLRTLDYALRKLAYGRGIPFATMNNAMKVLILVRSNFPADVASSIMGKVDTGLEAVIDMARIGTTETIKPTFPPTDEEKAELAFQCK